MSLPSVDFTSAGTERDAAGAYSCLMTIGLVTQLYDTYQKNSKDSYSEIELERMRHIARIYVNELAADLSTDELPSCFRLKPIEGIGSKTGLGPELDLKPDTAAAFWLNKLYDTANGSCVWLQEVETCLIFICEYEANRRKSAFFESRENGEENDPLHQVNNCGIPANYSEPLRCSSALK